MFIYDLIKVVNVNNISLFTITGLITVIILSDYEREIIFLIPFIVIT